MAYDHFLLLLVEELITTTKEQAQSTRGRPVSHANQQAQHAFFWQTILQARLRVSVRKTVTFR
jgi:hypothetical protein